MCARHCADTHTHTRMHFTFDLLERLSTFFLRVRPSELQGGPRRPSISFSHFLADQRCFRKVIFSLSLSFFFFYYDYFCYSSIFRFFHFLASPRLSLFSSFSTHIYTHCFTKKHSYRTHITDIHFYCCCHCYYCLYAQFALLFVD